MSGIPAGMARPPRATSPSAISVEASAARIREALVGALEALDSIDRHAHKADVTGGIIARHAAVRAETALAAVEGVAAHLLDPEASVARALEAEAEAEEERRRD